MNIRPLAERIWILDGPELVFAGAPMNTRMTVVQLPSGALWIHSPIDLSDELRDWIDAFDAPVAALVAPNKFHHLFIDQWRVAYPQAAVFAEPKLMNKIASLRDATALTDTAPALYADVIEQRVLSGNRLFHEAVFFHQPSRTLILTDLMMNLRIDRANFLAQLYLRFEDVVFPKGGVMRLYRWFTWDKARARADRDVMVAWAPQHLVFAHGDLFADAAVDVLAREFAYLV